MRGSIVVFVRSLVLASMALVISGCSATSGAMASAVDASPQATAAALASRWQPTLADTFQWQLSGARDATAPATVYDVDVFDTPAAFVASAHALGRHVVCYVDAGSYESGRPDAAAFPASVLGAAYVGYPQERWLDIRRIDLLAPIMDARLDRCRSAGFDAVEPDNINGWQNATGFPLTARDQIAYDLWFADRAHERGLAIALKNDGDQYAELASSYDFAIVEDCWYEGSCGLYAGFVAAGKAVFTVEYTDRTSSATFQQRVCPKARAASMTALLKTRALDATREVCS